MLCDIGTMLYNVDTMLDDVDTMLYNVGQMLDDVVYQVLLILAQCYIMLAQWWPSMSYQ